MCSSWEPVSPRCILCLFIKLRYLARSTEQRVSCIFICFRGHLKKGVAMFHTIKTTNKNFNCEHCNYVKK
jgi:hypothetical protein